MLIEQGSKKVQARTIEKKRQKVGSIEDIESGGGTFFSRLVPRNRKHKRESRIFRTERDRRYEEFHAMRMIQERTEHVNRWRALAVSVPMFAVLWLVGAFIFWKCEHDLQGWTYFQSVYFSWVCLLVSGTRTTTLRARSNVTRRSAMAISLP